MITRFLRWLVRGQYTPLTVAAAFLLGALGNGFPLWGIVIVGASIGVAHAVLKDLAGWILRRRMRTQ